MDHSSSLNRTLFESSLELKCLFFFGLALTVVISVSFFLYFWVTEAQIKAQNPQTANLLVEQDMVQKHIEWFTEGLKKEKRVSNEILTEDMKVDLDFKDITKLIIKGIRKEEFQCRAIRSGDYHNYYSSTPAGEFLPQSDLERKLLDRYLRVQGGELTDRQLENEYDDLIDDETQAYHYYKPIRVSDHLCTSCHKPVDEQDDAQIGDLIAIEHVTIPKPPAQNAMERNWAFLLGVSIITAFLSLIAFYIVIRLVIIRPLRNLRDVAEGISRGDISKRADLHTGDEFESLGAAFNRMLRHLVSTQEQLRTANNELEFKVDELAHITVELHETNRVKSDFMATMSHELRTPLNSILGFSDVLRSISTLTEKQKRYVENISKSGRTLLQMINDILDMAKLETGHMEVRLGELHIEHIIAAQSDMARPLLDKKNIDIEIEIEPDLPVMRQDGSRIQQILNNLLSNAIKFTPEGGRIRISVHREYRPPIVLHSPESSTGATSRISLPTKTIAFLVLQVSDTGVGISEADQQIVFEKFRQAKSSMPDGDAMKREYSGSGLGLSIVKELCRMMEGEIVLQSQLGLGSTFTVRLPWILQPRSRDESEMMMKIQQFSKARGKV